MNTNTTLMEEIRGKAWEGADQFDTLVGYFTDKDGNLWPSTTAYLQAIREVAKCNRSQQTPRKPELVPGYTLECHTDEVQTLLAEA